jgi:phage-related protein
MEHIAYEGERKRIVWARDGRRLRGKEYVASLRIEDRARVEVLLERMGDHGQIRDTEKFTHEGDGIFCFKRYQQRLPCFFDGRDVVVTHGFTKKQDAFPRTELDRAKRIRQEYLSRKEGSR